MIGMFSILTLALAIAVPAGAQQAPLAGSEWRVVSIGGEAVPEGVEALVQFGADGKLSGNGGCNQFTGTYVAEGAALTIGQVAATRRACPGPRMAVEQKLFAAFGAVRGFARDRADLVLTDAAGATLVVLVQTDWD